MAAIYDEEISKRLKLDPVRAAPLLMVGAGAGDGSPISPEIADILKQAP